MSVGHRGKKEIVEEVEARERNEEHFRCTLKPFSCLVFCYYVPPSPDPSNSLFFLIDFNFFSTIFVIVVFHFERRVNQFRGVIWCELTRRSPRRISGQFESFAPNSTVSMEVTHGIGHNDLQFLAIGSTSTLLFFLVCPENLCSTGKWPQCGTLKSGKIPKRTSSAASIFQQFQQISSTIFIDCLFKLPQSISSARQTHVAHK